MTPGKPEDPESASETPATPAAAHLEVVILRAQFLHLPQQLLFLCHHQEPGLFAQTRLLEGPKNGPLQWRSAPNILLRTGARGP